jgi:predicted CXXCH cytochrome family protein
MVIDSQIEGGVATDTDCQGCHSEPRENLLTYSCIGCHAINASAGDGKAFLGGYPVPQVYYADTTETKELAAGNFIHIVNNDWTYGHNVHGFQPVGIDADVDSILPPGYDSQMDPSTNKYDSWPYGGSLSPQQPLCAGTYGCHGNRNEDSQTMAMIGSHHSDDSMLQFGSIDDSTQGGSPGTSFRFLSGVKGGEDDDWEYSAASNDHNEYFGADVGARSGQTSQSSVETMSEFCASCHGIFHMTGLSDGRGISPTNASPWIRHPSDFMIPSSTPYSNYVTYELTARVARTTLPDPASSDTQIGSNSIVFCLSCHKAHASRQPDMLRYSYSAMTTGGSSSSNKLCFACHTDK